MKSRRKNTQKTCPKNHGSQHRHVCVTSCHEQKHINFFKLILSPSSQSNKLRIPEMFTKAYRSELSNTATLTVPTGESWKVALVEEDDKLWFRNGWKRFVEHYSIDYGYCLVFKFEGKMNFRVHVYDPSTCEISYESKVLYNSPKENVPSIEDDEDSDEEDKDDDDYVPRTRKKLICKGYDNSLQENAPRQRDVSPVVLRKEVLSSDDDYDSSDDDDSEFWSNEHEVIQLDSEEEKCNSDVSEMGLYEGNKVNFDTVHSREGSENDGHVSDYEDTKPYEASNPSTETSNATNSSQSELASWLVPYDKLLKAVVAAGIPMPEKPFFVAVIRPLNLEKACLTVPFKFAREHLGCTSKCALKSTMIVNLEAHDGNQFAVTCSKYLSKCAIYKGWKIFTRYVGLEVGDACIFEIIDTKNYVLKSLVVKKSQFEAAGLIV